MDKQKRRRTRTRTWTTGHQARRQWAERKWEGEVEAGSQQGHRVLEDNALMQMGFKSRAKVSASSELQLLLLLLLLPLLVLPPSPVAVVKCMPGATAVPQNSLTALLPFSSCAQLAASCYI